MRKKELVYLREKPMHGGGASLFLDYLRDGVRCKDYLRMYLIPERTRSDREQNQETLRTAQALRARKVLELERGMAGLPTDRGGDMVLIEYVTSLAADYRASGHREQANTYGKLARWLERFGRRVTLRSADRAFFADFIAFLQGSGLSEGTVHVYFANLNSVFNHAYRADLVAENPVGRMDRTLKPRRPDTVRAWLTLDEVRRLAGTPCPNAAVRAAFLFACFTGLRLSDVEGLTWDNIRASHTGWQVEERQLKTGQVVVVPLSDNALAQLPARNGQASGERVWARLPGRSQIGRVLRKWVADAGITKPITFHCARHTYATLLLTFGADLYTVSALLGHTDISTTQIYAKVVNEKKLAAVRGIPAV